ncbi:DNA polymerase Y family protein [Falsihalocynthiibacter sp. S25ZX9]|uniref:Y-family DNA polymerase n=1 Tax=Falsihalocynthiibacter sp. S25ZX9 TaxID=3240870 RepID=UPI00350FE424
MPAKRILSLWFPRLGAERLLRLERGTLEAPLAVARDTGNMQILSSLSLAASEAGLTMGQPLRDARAMCPALITRLQNPQAEADFLKTLRRWAGKFSPWVGEQGKTALILDITGCAHLFGGEESLLAAVEEDCLQLNLTVHAGIADTVGAAWALARYAGQPLGMARTGDAVDQEARATRSRATKRRNWERGGPTPRAMPRAPRGARIAAPGATHSALAPLPVAALRLPESITTQLTRLGIRQIGELAGMPRAALARRFGKDVMLRLDQAHGVAPEPVSPARAPLHFAVRLTLPEPIGLEADMLAGIDRLLPALAERLQAKGRGARRVRFQAFRTDQTSQIIEIGLARPSADPDRIRPLLAMKLSDIDVGFGVDILRIEAHQTESLAPQQHKGHFDASGQARANIAQDTVLDDLIGRLGARLGLEAITRRHPASSHLPEKAALTFGAAWSTAYGVDMGADAKWPAPATHRPLHLWRPEPLMGTQPDPMPPGRLKFRGQMFEITYASGPERVAPEWWLDDPDWRNGVRDYWRATTQHGQQLWIYFAHGAALSTGWFCHGRFA